MPREPRQKMKELRPRLRVAEGDEIDTRLSEFSSPTARNQELLRLVQRGLARDKAGVQPTVEPSWYAEMTAALHGLTAAVTALTARLQDGLVLPVAPHAPAASPSPFLDEADPFEGIDDVSALNFRTRDSSGA